MASAAAQAHFNRQSPADQAAIRASWGGADLMDDWYNNAVAAGAVAGQGANQGNLESLFAGQRAGDATGADAYRDPSYSGAQWGAWEQEERNRAGQANAHNTPNKYNPQGTGCPPNLPFTSQPGPDGKVECSAKPDDCPDGSGLHGSRCVGNDWLNANLGGDRPSEAEMGASFSSGGGGGGGYGAGGGGTAGGPQRLTSSGLLFSPGPSTGGGEFDDLQRALEDKFTSREGAFGFRDRGAGDQYAKYLGGGGLWWGGDKNMFSDIATMPAAAPSGGGGGGGSGGTSGGGGGVRAAASPSATNIMPLPPAPTAAPVMSPLEASLRNKFSPKKEWWQIDRGSPEVQVA